MSNRFDGTLCIGLSRRLITVVKVAGWLRSRTEWIAETVMPVEGDVIDTLVDELGRLLADERCACARVRIVLSDDWMRNWMVTPPQNATRLDDCVAAAQARFHALFGEAAAEWEMQADWDCLQPFLACAVPKRLMQALRDVARARGHVMVEAAPQFVVAWNRWRSQLGADAWFGVMHGGALTVAALARHGLQALRNLRLPEGALLDQRQLPPLLTREALRLNVAAPAAIRLCGEVPAHWVMQALDGLDFARLDRLYPAPHLPASAGVALALTGLHR